MGTACERVVFVPVDLDRLEARRFDPTRLDDAAARLFDAFRPLFEAVTPNERRLVYERVVLGKSLMGIGYERGVSESRACLMWNDLMRRLRQRADELGGFAALSALAD